MILKRLIVASVAAALIAGALAGCTEDPSIASDGTNTGYVSGAGAYKEIPPAQRKTAGTFTSVLENGKKISSASLIGKVHVLNFWYAGCGPCRVETPDLETVYKHYKGTVPFYGVDVYDQAATAETFETTHHVTYPSMIDTNTTAVQFAYAGYVSTDAVPTTLVIDKHGRVAARITGELEAPSILESLVDRVIAEGQ